MKTKECKGKIIFVCTKKGLGFTLFEKEDLLGESLSFFKEEEDRKRVIDDYIERNLTFDVYDLMSGREFLNLVESGCITDYDGVISEIFVDGYVSNLGLLYGGLCQGEILVDRDLWLELCKDHKVEVNWANK